MAKHMAPTRRSLTSTLARVLLLGLICQGLMLIGFSMTRAQTGTPQLGDSFQYTVKQSLHNGDGWFDGYTEDTTASGTYTITGVDAANITVHAEYEWKTHGYDSYAYQSNDTEGEKDRTVNISVTTRNYTQTLTDLDDYDGINGKNLVAWFWVPANLQKDQIVQILEHNYTVANEQVTIWSNGIPRYGLELVASGHITIYNYDGRNWDNSDFIDHYYVDRDSGYVFAERFEAQTPSILHRGYSGTRFNWTITYDITTSTFNIEFDVGLYTAIIIGIIAAIVLPALGIFVLYRHLRWRPRTDSFRSLGQIKIYLVKHLENFPQHLENRATDQFAAFLVDFAAKTLLAGGRVAVAADIGKNELLGVAYYNKEEGVGSIYCKNTEVTDALRQYIKCKDFFSEIRHEIPADLLENMRKFDNPNIKPQAFNIFETYQILKLAPIQHVDYDTNFISYMQEKDMSDVSKVAKEVYGRGGKRTFRALLESGDIGFVARVKGQIAGFAFASFVNQVGRNHTLSVLPKFRNQGIGRELARARLTTLANLGAQEVITEIADWNLPSLQVSSSLGFKKVGVMFVETARSIKTKKTIVRW